MKAAREAGEVHPSLIDSSLHRNIADAINGGLVQTAAERKTGLQPGTMDDRLQELVAEGKLVKVGINPT